MSEDGKSKMSSEERSKRRTAIGKAATEKVAKSEQLNFRLEEQSIRDLQKLAYKKGLPVGTMIRDWVLERLAKEKVGKSELSGKALQVLDEIHMKLNYLFAHDDAAEPLLVTESNPSVSYMLSAPGVPPLPVNPEPEKSEACDSRIEHLKAWEQLLSDQLNLIRSQREGVERSKAQ